MPEIRVVTIAERPDLAEVVAAWILLSFGHDENNTLEQIHEEVAGSTSVVGPPQVFVLLIEGEPFGTASLVAHDLDERPQLTPWLASVYVVPDARGRGYAGYLIKAVEAASRAASIATLWLYTSTAERVYQRAGWNTVEVFDRKGRPTSIMRRDLN